LSTLRHGGIIVHVKRAVDPPTVDTRVRYWSL
jgi:hypothetical protein